MFNEESKWKNWLAWTDRFLPVEIRQDPIQHLRCQLAMFFAVPGSFISLLLTAHAATLSKSGIENLLPFCIGNGLTILCAVALMNVRTIQLGLHALEIITTLMVIYGSYISGGFSSMSSSE